jgi:flagellin
MSLVINTNSIATTATRNLATNSANLSRSLARLSSGSKIVTPADDAGGLAVANKIKAALNRNVRTQQNVQNALSFMQVQDGALKVATGILDRMSELKTMSLDVTKNALDIANYDAEFTQLQEQLTNIQNEDFNGIGLFNETTNLTTYTTSDGDSSSEPSITSTRTGLFQELGNTTYTNALSVAEFTIDTAFTASTAAATTFVKSTDASTGAVRVGYIASTAAAVTAAGHGQDFAAAVAAGEVIEIDSANVATLYDSEADVARARVFESGVSTHLGGEVVYDNATNSFYLSATSTFNYDAAGAGAVNSTATAAGTVSTSAGELVKLDGYLSSTDHATYSSTEAYELGDIASFGGNLYVATGNISVGRGDPTVNTAASATAAAVAGVAGWTQISQNASNGGDLQTTSTTLSDYTTADFQTFIQAAATARAQNGAEMQRLNVSAEMLQANHTNFEAAHSRLADVDIATESTQFAKNNILVQSAAAMLAQANNLPSVALQLLQ